uniref:Tektin n=1 Tax=Platynereis dumerilii TaxID=6359 RepID=A0AA49K6S8_PLADU|nr:tektin 1 [Platynereis dumerilii]
MAKLVQAPPKFTHPEWNVSNQMKYANAEAERSAAERLIEESKRLDDDTRAKTRKTQRDVNKKLDQRLDDIKYWETEVNDKLDELKVETDNLLAFRTRVEKALEGCREPLHIAQQCLINRQKRIGIDLVHDDAERELLKEVEVIQGSMALLERTREQATEQIRLNRKAKYNLEKDLADKFAALSIDGHNKELKNYSAELHFKDGVAKIDANSVTPQSWESFSNKNIEDAEKQRHNSVGLRTLMDGILQSTANDMNKQKESVDIALNRRIDETRDSKEKLEDHLSKVVKQIQEMEDNISRLTKAIEDKQNPMMLNQTRLENRSYRPNVELCSDAVQYRLVQEVTEIGVSVAQLQERLAQSQESLKGLVRRQLDLEEDIKVKANTLFIDETECMGMRKSISIQAY